MRSVIGILLSRSLAAAAGVTFIVPALVVRTGSAGGVRAASSAHRAGPIPGAMDTCPRCGARVTPDLEWCGQCLVALPRQPADRAPLQVAMRQRAAGAPVTPSEFSRWRSSPTSFGPVGRSMLTLGTLLGLVAGYPLLRGLMLAAVGVDVPGKGFVLLYVVLAIPAGLYLVGRIWKRVRVA
jgi:hypothetical protein